MTQTLALLLDAYRELNAKKLFWVVLAISLIGALVVAAIGLHETGFSFLWWSFDSPTFNSQIIPKKMFYVGIFTSLGINIWLTWAATILALIATAGIFPDFISGGSIDLALSKPIGRLRLFLSKYTLGLLFATLQVLVFSVAAFFVLGWRASHWDPAVFLAVPIVAVFFSYLFCVCTLVGLVTRSTIAALLVTLLFWFALFGTNAADGMLISFRESAAVQLEDKDEEIENQRRIAEITARRELLNSGEIQPQQMADELNLTEEELVSYYPPLAQTITERDAAEASHRVWSRWTGIVTTIRTVLPKTNETIALLERSLISDEEIRGQFEDAPDDANAPAFANPRVQERVELARRDRSLWWILGTSLGFEAVVLALSALIFCRRDF